MSIAALVLDFYDDTEKELMSKVAMPSSLRDVPVNILSPDEHAALRDNEFGLLVLTKRASLLRKFPLNDPGNAWLSSQYFDANHEKLAFPARFVAAKYIKEACDAYGVPSSPRTSAYAARAEEVDSNLFTEGSEQGWLLGKLAQREMMAKQAEATEYNAMLEAPDDHFALVIRNGDGEVLRKYAMPDEHRVRMAAEYFDKYAMDLHPEHRHQFAQSVRNRAAELDVDVSDVDSLQKWAGEGWNRHLMAHIEHRKSLLPMDENGRGALDKLAAMMTEAEPADFAKALHTVDQATGLDRYYDRGLADPYSSVMGKHADAWSADVEGHQLTKEDLDKVTNSPQLASYLGGGFAKQFRENPVEIFESLPQPEKVLIKQIATGEA